VVHHLKQCDFALELFRAPRDCWGMANLHTRRGFTLLEVLVCVAIIFILIALLLPVLGRGDKTPNTLCLSNQRQLAIAALMYHNDNKSLFPNLDSLLGNDGPIALSLLTNYIGQRTNLFMCPFVVRQREKERSVFQKKFVPVFDPSFFRSNGNDYAYYDGVVTNALTDAFIADRFAWTNRFAPSLPSWNHAKGRINAAFVDGHVENLRPDRIVGEDYDPAWSAVQDPILR
jgi:prepilin-type N-terminal cleavage/methylation domain-containing protein/prepilin-type processing-associated H-X9-DG protein